MLEVIGCFTMGLNSDLFRLYRDCAVNRGWSYDCLSSVMGIPMVPSRRSLFCPRPVVISAMSGVFHDGLLVMPWLAHYRRTMSGSASNFILVHYTVCMLIVWSLEWRDDKSSTWLTICVERLPWWAASPHKGQSCRTAPHDVSSSCCKLAGPVLIHF